MTNRSKSPFGNVFESQSNATNAEAKRDELALRCENLTNKAVRPPYRCITCKKLAREHKDNDVKKCHGKPNDDTYLQVLNDQNRKTAKWLDDQATMEKNNIRMRQAITSHEELSQEKLKQIDNLRAIHERDEDAIQRLEGQVNDSNRQYQTMLQRQDDNQTQLTELRHHISVRDNIIEDVIRLQNNANAIAAKIPSATTSATPPMIDLTTNADRTAVKQIVDQIERISESNTVTQNQPLSSTSTENQTERKSEQDSITLHQQPSTIEEEDVFQDSNGHSQEAETKLKEYLTQLDKSENHVLDLIGKLDKANSDITTISDKKSEAENQNRLLKQKLTSTENNLERVKEELSQAHLEATRTNTDINEKEHHHNLIQKRNDDLNDQLETQGEQITDGSDQIESLKNENKELQEKIDEAAYNISLGTIKNLEDFKKREEILGETIRKLRENVRQQEKVHELTLKDNTKSRNTLIAENLELEKINAQNLAHLSRERLNFFCSRCNAQTFHNTNISNNGFYRYPTPTRHPNATQFHPTNRLLSATKHFDITGRCLQPKSIPEGLHNRNSTKADQPGIDFNCKAATTKPLPR